MQTRPLGQLEVGVVGLGCNNFGGRIDADATDRVVHAAIEAGVTYFDTAEGYNDGRSEELLGRAIGDRRDQVLVATKWGHTSSMEDGEHAGRPEQVRTRLEASLRRLGMDHVDHYQLHRPDPATPIAETLGCLQELVDEGRVREIGCTGFTTAQLAEAADVAGAEDLRPFASVQNHYSVLTRAPETDGVFATCRDRGVAFVPYFPLESGLLTGKYRAEQAMPDGARLTEMADRADSFVDDERLAVVEELIAWTADHDRSLLDLAISWHTSHELVATVIAGATRPEQVEANVAAAGWSLTDDERAEVDAIVAPVRADEGLV